MRQQKKYVDDNRDCRYLFHLQALISLRAILILIVYHEIDEVARDLLDGLVGVTE